MLLIKNGRVVDPHNNVDDFLDVLVEEGKIKGIAPEINAENAAVIDASNRVVAPGLIDMHVHFRQPGEHEYKETIASGCRAAAKGGFTTVVCEPNTVPPIDSAEKLKEVLDLGRRARITNVYSKASITKRLRGREVVDIGKVVNQGAVALTDDGFPVVDIEVMGRAAREARKYGIPICPHSEETRLWGRRQAKVRAYHQSEAAYIKRDVHLVRDTNCSFHFAHVSLAKSVSYIALAKKEGLPVTAEATPHHFTLTRDDFRRIGPNAFVNPPLRTAEDVEAIKQALRDNVIEVIATDHAPHAPYEKMGRKPPLGVIGLETTLGIVLTHLVHSRVLSLSSAIEKMTANPARVLNLKRGELRIGMAADITVIDLNKEWVVDVEKFESKGRNCPFEGSKLKGKAVMTIVGGKIVMKAGEIIDPPTEDPRLLQQLRLPISE